ncbi:MAG TPA: UPF0147 family protein [Candidatus Nanoarchaeia archaeon]|nr:UPF0147 family protein [Candidatus Nanoarchaeia archaeon]
MNEVNSAVDSLVELKDDASVPKNIKLKIEETISALRDTNEVSIKIHKALNLLEEIAEDTNLKSYTRTQIWSIISSLENLG